MKTGDKVIITREPSGIFDSDEVGKIGIICAIEEYENGECEYEIDTGNGNKFWYISGEFLLYNDFWHKLDETPIEDKECLLLLRFHKKVFSKLANVRNSKFYYRDGELVPVNFVLAWAYTPELPSWIEE